MRYLLIALLSLIVTGCGGDSKTSNQDTPSVPVVDGGIDGNTDPVDPVSPISPVSPNNEKTEVYGTISGLTLSNTTVSVFDFSTGQKGNLLGKQEILDGQSYSIEINQSTQENIIAICANGGSYKEIASEQFIELEVSDELCSLVTFYGDQKVSTEISPLTQIEKGFAEARMKHGNPVSFSVDQSRNLVKEAFGINDENSDKVQSILLIAASQYMREQAELYISETHTKNYSSYAFFNTAYNDIKEDGRLDGKGKSFDLGPQVDLGIGGTIFNGSTYTGELARSAIKYLSSNSSDFDLGLEDILEYCKSIASTTHYLFGYNIGEINEGGLDSVSPMFFESSVEDGDILRGIVSMHAIAEDNLLVSETALYIDDVLIKNIEGGVFQYNLDTSSLEDGSHEIKLVAIDLMNNETISVKRIRSVNAPTYLKMVSKKIANSTTYDLTADIINNGKEIISIKINGETVSSEDEQVSKELLLNNGRNNISYELVFSDGKSFAEEFIVNVDTTPPEISVTHIESTYRVHYEHSIGKLATYPLRFSDDYHPFHIDQFHRDLNGAAATLDNLISVMQPFIRFYVNDPGSIIGAFTAKNELEVKYKYLQDSVLIKEAELNGDLTDDLIIPISTEYLAEGWVEYNGKHLIEIHITDKAGNALITEFPFKTYGSKPSIGTGEGVASSVDGKISLTGDDVDSFDTIKFEVNGVVYTAPSNKELYFDLDEATLTQGENFGFIRGYKNGVLSFAQRVDFKVDMTAPEIYVDNVTITNSESPSIIGIATDPESEIASVGVDGVSANYNPFNDNFSFVFEGLEDGYHDYSVSTTNSVGLTKTVNARIRKDTLKPRRTIKYPNDPNYFVKVQSNSNNPPTSVRYSDLDAGSSVYYMNTNNISLNGIEPTLANMIEGKYIFLHCFYSDRWSNYAQTERGDLEVTYSYKVSNQIDGISGEWRIKDKSVDNIDGNFILPFTVEYLGETYRKYSNKNTFHIVYVYVKDEAGNVDTRHYTWRINYDPDDNYPLN